MQFLDRDLEIATYTAWRTAELSRPRKKFPKLEALLKETGRKKPKVTQTADQMMAVCMNWNALLGGRIVDPKLTNKKA